MGYLTKQLHRRVAHQMLLTGARGAAVKMVIAIACIGGTAGAQPTHDVVGVGKKSALADLVPAEQIEQSAKQQYQQTLQEANKQNALVPADDAALKRLRTIAQRIIAFAPPWNDRANQWQWQVYLIRSPQINAYCMPGGKIAFYTGILETLKLTDDEAAMVMGHEIAHALREHARERMGKTTVTNGLARLGGLLAAGVLGIDPNLTDFAARQGAGLLSMKFSREDETEADLVGMELAARAGFDPRAGITLWQKMSAANKNAPPQWLSTHPASGDRIQQIQASLDKVMPLYESARQK